MVSFELVLNMANVSALGVLPTIDVEPLVPLNILAVVLWTFAEVKVVAGFIEDRGFAADVTATLKIVVVVPGAPAEVVPDRIVDFCDGNTDVIAVAFVDTADVVRMLVPDDGVAFLPRDKVRRIGITIAATITTLATAAAMINIYFLF